MQSNANRHTIFCLEGTQALLHRTTSFFAIFLSAASPLSNAEDSPAPQVKMGPQCPGTNEHIIQRFAVGMPDLSGEVFDEASEPVERLGSSDCPSDSATQCQKLYYLTFMFRLLDMSSEKYRAPGISAFMANLEAEHAEIGAACSAEVMNYSAPRLVEIFSGQIQKYFCSASSKAFNHQTAIKAGIIQLDGSCDTSPAGLGKLRATIFAEAPATLRTRPGYDKNLAPVVARLYRTTFNADNDEDAFRFRGRGFIQLTGRANYMQCQSEIVRARQYLQAHPKDIPALKAVTGVDWLTLDVVDKPEAVSQSRFIGAFCAASYWHHRSAPVEMTWDKQGSKFATVVLTINSDKKIAQSRIPKWQKWCGIAKCDKNYPSKLNVDSGLAYLATLSRKLKS